MFPCLESGTTSIRCQGTGYTPQTPRETFAREHEPTET